MPPGIGYTTQDLDQEALQRSFRPKPAQPLSDPWAAGLTPTQAGVQTDAPSRDPWAMGVMSPGGPVQPLSQGGPMPPSPPPADPIPPPAPPPTERPLSDPSWQPQPTSMGGLYDPGGTYQWGGGTTPLSGPTSLGGLYDPGGTYAWGGQDWNTPTGGSLLLRRLFEGI